MHLLIDYREKHVSQHIVDVLSNDSFSFQNLHLGDFQFVNHPRTDDVSFKINMIIERKTINDLAASVKDGRYMEQKMRLLSKRREDPELKLAYILEGNYSFSPKFTCANINNKTLSGVLINSIVRDNILIFVTKDVNDTNFLLLNLFERFSRDSSKYFNEKKEKEKEVDQNGNENDLNLMAQNNQTADSIHPINPNTCPQYTSCVIASKLHSVKKDNLDEKMCLEMQLSCIPGVSSKKASSIVQGLQIKSIYDLGCLLKEEEGYNEDQLKKGGNQKNILTDIDGIGKKLDKTIRRFVLGTK